MSDRFDHVSDLYERLDGDGRRRFVDPELLTVNSPEALAKAREFINNIISQNVISAAQLARRTGIKPVAISGFRNSDQPGKWKGKQSTLYTVAGELVRAVDQYLQQQEAEESALATLGAAETRFLLAVRAMARYCIKRRKIAVFSAPAGTGKSLALRVIRDETPGAVLVIVRQSRASLRSFMRIVARELGLPELSRVEDLQDRIIACLRLSCRLILVDEGHKLSLAALDGLREIWDAVNIPILIAGTPTIYTTLTSRRIGTQTGELLDQIYSRVMIYRDLSTIEDPDTGEPTKLFNAEDIRRLFHRGSIRLARDGADFLCRLANSLGGGGLRTATDLVQTVADLYPGEVVTEGLLSAALRAKIGPREAGFQLDRAGLISLNPPPAKVAAG